MVIHHGEIWWSDLGKPRGSEPAFTRPVLVISADSFNASQINTVVIAVLTSNVALAQAPGNVLVSQTDSGLPKPSVVNVSQLLTVDKSFLIKKVGKLSRAALHNVTVGLRLVLDLP